MNRAASTPSGITGRSGWEKRVAPSLSASIAASERSTLSTMANAAREVQTSASQGCIGALARSAIIAIGGRSAKVWVTPIRE